LDVKVAVNTETTSYNDESVLTAFDEARAADIRHGRSPPQLAVIDNVGHDAKGVTENIWLNEDLPLFRFDGDVKYIRTEEEMDAAASDLRVSADNAEYVEVVAPRRSLGLNPILSSPI